MLYNENIGTNEAYSDNGHDTMEQVQQCKMIGCIFKQDGHKSVSKNSCFLENFTFPMVAQYNLSKIIEGRINGIERKIKNIRVLQSRWPEILHDYS